MQTSGNTMGVLVASVIAFFASEVGCHSWLLQIGDRGLKRGGLEGDDHAKTRYYCPYADISRCRPATSAVVLPQDVARPCQPGKSVPMASMASGSELYLGWQGNGHVGKSEGSCVSVSIAPYASDPHASAFQRLVECAPFSRGWSPDMTVPISVSPGEYTIWWVWQFAGFFYSSCADIVVSPPAATGSSGSASGNSPKMSIAQALTLPYETLDCAALDDPDGYCITKFGTSIPTYCKKYSKNACGRSVCQGYDAPVACSPTGNSTASTPAATVGTAVLTASELRLPVEYTDCRQVGNPDLWCRNVTGNVGSHCKTWSADACGRAHCFGYERPKNLPCRRQIGCEAAPKPHEYCSVVFGRGSYCKLDQRDRCGRSWCFGQLNMAPCL